MVKQHVIVTLVFEMPIGQDEENQIKRWLQNTFEPEKLHISYEDYED